jgi:hypothetical protein
MPMPIPKLISEVDRDIRSGIGYPSNKEAFLKP